MVHRRTLHEHAGAVLADPQILYHLHLAERLLVILGQRRLFLIQGILIGEYLYRGIPVGLDEELAAGLRHQLLNYMVGYSDLEQAFQQAIKIHLDFFLFLVSLQLFQVLQARLLGVVLVQSYLLLLAVEIASG